MTLLGITSFAAGTVAYAGLAGLLLSNRRTHTLNKLLLAVCLVSALWLGSMLLAGPSFGSLPLLPGMLELARAVIWCLFLTEVIERNAPAGCGRRIFGLIGVPMSLLALGLGLYASLIWRTDSTHAGLLTQDMLVLIAAASLAVMVLVLLEFLIRRTHVSSRCRLDLLFVAVGALFTYDMFFYADALLIRRIDPDLWYARGVLNAVCVPILALAIQRNPSWRFDLFLSRDVVFRSAVLAYAREGVLLAG